MPLKLSLKPGEKFVLNGAVLANGDKRTSLVIQNKACVLREKDIMQPEGANTPARRIYLAIMMMYLDGEASEEPYNEFALRMTEFMGAISLPGLGDNEALMEMRLAAYTTEGEPYLERLPDRHMEIGRAHV